ncbi:relaxase/mobilization nuclease domain-containing protein [Hyphomonadaceae bacterium ML37]|nr:relaxase/mobilization nuclease domain-containing protein [Hyphomonadaceae bacterium ML37]
MILKGSQRGGAKQLALHLMKTEENEHVEIHEVRGFLADDVLGALREAEAISQGTKCRQFLFSVSLNPPQTETVSVKTFENALASIEERTGLSGQPRIVVFHEKEGRRHCHAVWSRIDPETMTAKPLPYFKNKLQEVSRQQYLENGWRMPPGLIDKRNRDPRNFTLAEWQQAKRAGRNAGEIKSLIQEAWSISDSKGSFAHALKERGFYLAKGDRRGHIAMSFDGEPFSVPRMLGQKTRDVRARLGDPKDLPSIEDARKHMASDYLPKIQKYVGDIRQKAKAHINKIEADRRRLQAEHATERKRIDDGIRKRSEREQRERAERFRKGMLGLWDRLSGKHKALEKQNQMEALWALERDRRQRDAMVAAQLQERRGLQERLKAARERRDTLLLKLYRDYANYRDMKRGAPPSRPAAQREQTQAQPKPIQKSAARNTLDRKQEALKQQFRQNAQNVALPAEPPKPAVATGPVKAPSKPSTRDRLNRLRRGDHNRSDGPDLER